MRMSRRERVVGGSLSGISMMNRLLLMVAMLNRYILKEKNTTLPKFCLRYIAGLRGAQKIVSLKEPL